MDNSKYSTSNPNVNINPNTPFQPTPTGEPISPTAQQTAPYGQASIAPDQQQVPYGQPIIPQTPQPTPQPQSGDKMILAKLPKIIFGASVIIFIIGIIHVVMNAPALKNSSSTNSSNSTATSQSVNSSTNSSSSSNTSSTKTTFTIAEMDNIEDISDWASNYVGKTITVTGGRAQENSDGEIYEISSGKLTGVGISCVNASSLNLVKNQPYTVTGVVEMGSVFTLRMTDCTVAAE